ncbi:MAG: hypothetical protein AAFX90_17390 [Pseudomonadota bacterium]
MSQTLTLPHVSLDLLEFEPQNRWVAWSDYNSGFVDVEPNIPSLQQMYAKSVFYNMGNTVIGRQRHCATIFRRDLAHSSLQREECLVLSLNHSGTTTGLVNDRSTVFSPSQLCLFNFDQSLRFNTDECDYTYISIPFSDLGYDPSRHQAVLHIDRSSPMGRILQSNLELVLEGAQSYKMQDAIALGDGFCGLLKGLISRNLRDDSVFQHYIQSREVAVRRFVEENLRDPGLDAALICNSIGVSRSVLHRIFLSEGGVSRAIKGKRLDGARSDLTKLEPKRGIIAEVSRYWCFNDQSRFSTLFRERFKVKPSDIIGSSLMERNADKPNVCSRRHSVTRLASLYRLHQAPSPISDGRRCEVSNAANEGASQPGIDRWMQA